MFLLCLARLAPSSIVSSVELIIVVVTSVHWWSRLGHAYWSVIIRRAVLTTVTNDDLVRHNQYAHCCPERCSLWKLYQ